MQQCKTFVEVWENPRSSRVQVCVAYGGASALLILVKQNTDAKQSTIHAAEMLNQAAEQLGLPQLN